MRIGLTVAKVGEALVMADQTDDLLMAYPRSSAAVSGSRAAGARANDSCGD